MRVLQSVTDTPTAVARMGENLAGIDPYLVVRTPFEFGAVGDGVTDDTAALAAIATLTNYIYLPSGYTFLTTGLSLTNKNRFHIFGGGCLKLAPASNGPVLTLTDCYRSTVEDILIDGNRAAQSGGGHHGIRAINFLFSTVRNCRVYECDGTGIYMTASSWNTDESHLVGNYVDFCNGYGIVISGTGDHIVKANQVKFCKLGNIWLYGCYNITVEGNQVLSAGLDAYFSVLGAGRGILLQYSPRCVVIGNQVRANTQEGIYVLFSDRCVVSSNFCQFNSMEEVGKYAGIHIASSSGVVVSTNHSGDVEYAKQEAPFNLIHQSHGLTLLDAVDVAVTGNDLDAEDNVNGGCRAVTSTYQARGNLGLPDFPTANATTLGPLAPSDWTAFYNRGGRLKSPFDYGARGDGTTDDTAAVQAAIDTDNYLFLPAGNTFLVSHLEIKNHNYPNRQYRVFGGGCLRQKAGSAQVMLYIYNCDSMYIDGIEFDGNRANQTTSNWGIYCVNMNYSRILNCSIHDFSGTGLVFDRSSPGLCDENEVANCQIIFCNGFGFYCQNCGDHGISNNHIGWNAWEGLAFVGCYSTRISGNHILSNTNTGLKISGSGRFVIDNNEIRENRRHGVWLENADGHKLLGNRIHWNSVEAEDAYDGIHLENCTHLQVIGNASNNIAYVAAGSPVNGRNLQRFGLWGSSCSALTIVGNSLAPNHSGGTSLAGCEYLAGCNVNLDDHPLASASTTGPLSAADWSVFAAKIAGAGTSGRLAKFVSGGSVADSVVSEANGNVGVGSAAPTQFKLQVAGSLGPETDASFDLGSESRRWGTVHGVVFNGNAATATDADTLDGNHAAAFAATAHTHPYEPALGNPTEDDRVLSSTANGARSWFPVSSNLVANSLVARNGDGDVWVRYVSCVYALATAVSAGGLAVTAGNPATNKYLIAADGNGSVTWSVLRALDGTPGMSGTRDWLDANGSTHSVTIKNGLITEWTVSP